MAPGPIVYEWRDGKYTGDFKAGKPHGTGKWTSNEMNTNLPVQTYKGSWTNGEWDGIGELTVVPDKEGTKYPSIFQSYHKVKGFVYKGQFQQEKMQGFGEIMNLDSKNVFKGSFKDNKEDCSKDGEMQYGLGGQYVGQWAAEGDAEPVREGIGCMIMYDGKRYNGSWKKDSMAGEPAGYGVMIYVDGSTYEGDWVINPSQPAAGTNMGGAQQAFIEGERDSSFGVYRYVNGDVYEGKWEKDVRCNGSHTCPYTPTEENEMSRLIYANGDVYVGDFNSSEEREDAAADAKSCMRYKNGDKYTGMWLGSDRHGQGKMEYANGDVYDGMWLHNQKHTVKEEKGVMTYNCGDVYTGPWWQDVKSGTAGVMVYANKDEFTGDWMEDARKDGVGKMVYKSLPAYEGEDKFPEYNGHWINCQRSGRGIHINESMNKKGIRYEGEWCCDLYHGFGRIVYTETSDVFTGEFKYGKRFFRGKLEEFHSTDKVKCVYEGEFTDHGDDPEVHPKKNGYGVAQCYGVEDGVNPTHRFSGHFKDGERLDGAGKMEYIDSLIEIEGNAVHVYEGEFERNKSATTVVDHDMHHRVGKGSMTWKNGDTYTGDWAANQMAGKGCLKNVDGVYTGAFAADKYSGRGELQYSIKTTTGAAGKSEPESYEGEWSEGKQEGAGTMIFRDASMFIGPFKEGKRDAGRAVMKYGMDDPKYGTPQPESDNAGVYDGFFLAEAADNTQMREGQGTMTYKNGDVYVGEWAANKRSGDGAMTYKVEKRQEPFVAYNRYIGGWKDDKFDCTQPAAMGRLMFESQQCYEGYFGDGLRTGDGTQHYANGNKYTGSWDKDTRSAMAGDTASGCMKYANGDVYQGNWNDKEQKDGQGTMAYANGDNYVGKWANDVRSQAAAADGDNFTRSNGDVYVGPWKDDFMATEAASTGIMTYKCGDVYTGKWVKNMRHDPEGTSVLEIIHLSGPDKGRCDKFTGTFNNDERVDCHGVMEYANLDKYEGQWKRNQREGQGTQTHADTNLYTGQWLRDAMHGQGTYNFNKVTLTAPEGEGDEYIGEFRYGRRGKSGIMQYGATPKNSLDINGMYDGEWDISGSLGCVRHGAGMMTYSKDCKATHEHYTTEYHGGVTCEGSVYIGHFAFGQRRDGYGEITYTAADGGSYKGQFVQAMNGIDYKHGTGEHITPGGKRTGDFIEGEYYGAGYSQK